MSYQIKTKKLPKSEIEIEVSLEESLLNEARKKAITILSNKLEIPGFRKGHIPENIVIQKAGENYILEEASDILISEHFPKIIEENKFDILGRPKISITKLAVGNPVEFKAVFAVMPEFDLPDYKKIAETHKSKKEEKFEATEKETEDVLLQIRKNKAHYDWHKNNPDHKDHNHPDLEKEENLPKIDDEFAKSAGNFNNVEELKEKVKQNIIEEKKNREIEKRRAQIMEDLVKKTKIELPEILVESEIEKSLAQLKDDVARIGAKWEDYLKETKKEESEIRKELRDQSENKAKIQIIFNKIAEVEKIEPNKDILENEVKNLMNYYPDASEINARTYVETILINQEVLKLLEK